MILGEGPRVWHQMFTESYSLQNYGTDYCIQQVYIGSSVSHRA